MEEPASGLAGWGWAGKGRRRPRIDRGRDVFTADIAFVVVVCSFADREKKDLNVWRIVWDGIKLTPLI